MKKRRLRLILFGAVVGGVLACWLWMVRGLTPTAPGAPFYVRYMTAQRVKAVFHELQNRQVIRDPGAMRVYTFLHRGPNTIPVGTYQFRAGESAQDVLQAIENPIRQMMRIPETNWSMRNANLLAHSDVTTAHDYMALVHDPAAFKGLVSFPLPKQTLEGYLLPDKYDLPPLLGARAVIDRQLKAFDQKVWKQIGRPKNLQEVVTKASLVELEAGSDQDRAMIAGVIENRLKKNMPLQIDASLLYGIGKWRRLYFKDYKDIHSPYNLYLHKGLPPTPICSPSLKSIQAAMNPAHHEFLYYVAMPDGQSVFSKTFGEHKKKIQKRLAALKGSVKTAPPPPAPVEPAESTR